MKNWEQELLWAEQNPNLVYGWAAMQWEGPPDLRNHQTSMHMIPLVPCWKVLELERLATTLYNKLRTTKEDPMPEEKEGLAQVRLYLDKDLAESLGEIAKLSGTTIDDVASILTVMAFQRTMKIPLPVAEPMQETIVLGPEESPIEGWEKTSAAMAALNTRAAIVFGNEEKAERWMTSPKRIFDGDSPLEYAQGSPEDYRAVEELLLSIEHGNFQ